MSELESVCHAFDASLQPLPALVNSMQQRAARLRAVAAEVQHAARQVPDPPDVSRVVQGLLEAASAIDRSGQAILNAVGHGRAYVQRTIGGGGSATTGGGAGVAGDSGLSAGDRAALADYTGTGYSDMNSALRGRTPMDEDVARRADAVSAALSRLPDRPGWTRRGTDLSPEVADKYVVGKTVTEGAFTSTSTDAPFVGNTQFLVLSKHGKDVSPYSRHAAEAEVLFDRDTDFEVTANYFDASGRRIIVMSEV